MADKRQFVNNPENFVLEALEGFTLSHASKVCLNAERGLIYRAVEAKRGKVGLVSGGGSGHEPLHVGFVGQGMLDVAVAGAVFASPTAVQIHEGTKLANNGAGVLHIVKNYTGDVINFSLAADLAEDDSIEVQTVIVNDDVATDSEEGPGRRGTAAVIAVEKICGAAAEKGYSLPALKMLGDRVVANSATLSLAIEAGTIPGKNSPAFELDSNEVEFGVGIHGERGKSRIEFKNIDSLAHTLLVPILDDLKVDRGERVLVIVNGLGSTHDLELATTARAINKALTEINVIPLRWLTGNLVTSLDMRGISITLLKLDDELLQLWDAPVSTSTLNWS